MSSLDDYFGRVRAAVWVASEYVSTTGLAEARRLVEHGEPAEGMCILAWVIVNEDVRVPASLIRDIRVLSEELVPVEQMPPDLDEHAIAGES